MTDLELRFFKEELEKRALSTAMMTGASASKSTPFLNIWKGIKGFGKKLSRFGGPIVAPAFTLMEAMSARKNILSGQFVKGMPAAKDILR